MAELSPSALPRRLGAEMRELREGIGMTAAEAASRIGASPSKISRLENGLRGPKVPDIAALLELYQVSENRTAELLGLARKAGKTGDTPSAGRRLSKGLRALINQEKEALGFRVFEATAVPALLQTGDYARAVFSSSPSIPTGEVDEWVAVLLARQAILARARPPKLSVIIAEQVLRSPVGSPAVFAAQLDHLLDRATRPDVQLRILPDTAGAFASFTLLDLIGTGPTVHLNAALADRVVGEPGQIAEYQRIFAHLTEESLDPARSMGFIARLGTGIGAEETVRSPAWTLPARLPARHATDAGASPA